MNVGVVGLGAMGAPMVVNLHKAGHLSAIWNRTSSRASDVTEATGIEPAVDLQALASACDVIILSVSADADVMQVLSTLLPDCKTDTTIIDTSTVSTSTAIKAHAACARHEVNFLDAPVSGGVEGARNATLSMMIGGEEDVLQKVRPVLDAISKTVVHLGPVGNGQATKAVNQIMAAGINEAVTEALAFGEAMGLPMDKVIEAVGGGAAGNWFLTNRGPTMVSGIYDPGFRVALHDKDLGICEAMAEEKSMALPVVSMTRKHYRSLMNNGDGGEDISALYKLKR